MRWLLGCIGLIFILFGGCVLVIFSNGVAPDEIVFAIGAVLIFFSGIWMLYKAVTMRSAAATGNRPEGDGDLS
jgi:hypothetical protein